VIAPIVTVAPLLGAVAPNAIRLTSARAVSAVNVTPLTVIVCPKFVVVVVELKLFEFPAAAVPGDTAIVAPPTTMLPVIGTLLVVAVPVACTDVPAKLVLYTVKSGWEFPLQYALLVAKEYFAG
jgi:hypothetical protein